MSEIDAKTLHERLEHLLNSHSREGHSNTPDFVLAEYMMSCLCAFEKATGARDKWYGVHLAPGGVRPLVSPASEGGKVEPAEAHGVWRCECCAEIASAVDSRFRWNGECWQHHHAEAQTHFDCRFFGPKPEPVAAPSSEMPEAVREAARILRVASKGYVGFTTSFLGGKADALESFWRTHAAQPAKVRMTEELKDVLAAANAKADRDSERGNDKQANEVWNAIAAVRAQAAEVGKVRLPKVRALLESRPRNYPNLEYDAALAELNAAEKVTG